MYSQPDSTSIKNLFAKIATRYKLANHVLCGGLDLWWRHVTAQEVAKCKPQQILDVATGSGDLAFAILKKIPTAQITGIDFCKEMLMEAAKKNGATLFSLERFKNCYSRCSARNEEQRPTVYSDTRGPEHRSDAVMRDYNNFENALTRISGLRLLQADGMNLPFANESYDAVTIAFGLRNMASWEQGLREMHRVLRLGGSLFILDFSLPTVPLLKSPYRFYLHHLLPRLAGIITGQSEAYSYMADSIEQFPSGKKMEKLLENCGFQQATSKPMTFGVVTLYRAAKI